MVTKAIQGNGVPLNLAFDICTASKKPVIYSHLFRIFKPLSWLWGIQMHHSWLLGSPKFRRYAYLPKLITGVISESIWGRDGGETEGHLMLFLFLVPHQRHRVMNKHPLHCDLSKHLVSGPYPNSISSMRQCVGSFATYCNSCFAVTFSWDFFF